VEGENHALGFAKSKPKAGWILLHLIQTAEMIKGGEVWVKTPTLLL